MSSLMDSKDVCKDSFMYQPPQTYKTVVLPQLNKKRTDKQVQRRVARLTATYMKKTKKLEELGVYIPLQTLIGTLPQKVQREGPKLDNMTHL